jgi:hypothetical protein
MKIQAGTDNNSLAAWTLTIIGIGLELLAAAIWQEAGLGKSIAHAIVSFFR